jgi:RNA polymerase sigma-70 factor (ECF subfamily)
MAQRDREGDSARQLDLLASDDGRPAPAPEIAGGLPDSELISRIGTGDEFDFRTLYERHAGWLIGFLIRLGRSPEDAEEICDDVFVDLKRAASAGHLSAPSGCIRPWLATDGRRRSIDLYRRRRRDPPLTPLGLQADQAADTDLERTAQAREANKLLHERVARNVDRGAAVLKLILMDFTQDAIAAQLCMSRDQVRGRLAKIADIARGVGIGLGKPRTKRGG